MVLGYCTANMLLLGAEVKNGTGRLKYEMTAVNSGEG